MLSRDLRNKLWGGIIVLVGIAYLTSLVGTWLVVVVVLLMVAGAAYYVWREITGGGGGGTGSKRKGGGTSITRWGE